MALALILLVGAALLIRTFVALRAVNPGFDPAQRADDADVALGIRVPKSAAVDQLIRDGIERLGALPGVEIASATCCVPLEGGYGLPFIIVGRPLDGPLHGGGGWRDRFRRATSTCSRFRSMRGRAFTDRGRRRRAAGRDHQRAMAKQYWPDGDPLNDRIMIGARRRAASSSNEPARQIVGIVGDVRDGGLNRDPRPSMYVPDAQIADERQRAEPAASRRSPGSCGRASSRYSLARAAFRKQLRQVERGLPVRHVRSMDEVVARSTRVSDFNMLLLTMFGGVGAAAGGDRHLRADGVLGPAADAGDRHPPGARRADAHGPEHGDASRA